MKKLYEIFNLVESIGLNFDELIILSFLSNQWDLNKELDSKCLVNQIPRYSKSTIHRKLNELRNKNIIDYQVDYSDGRKIKIIKGTDYQKMIDLIGHQLGYNQHYTL